MRLAAFDPPYPLMTGGLPLQKNQHARLDFDRNNRREMSSSWGPEPRAISASASHSAKPIDCNGQDCRCHAAIRSSRTTWRGWSERVVVSIRVTFGLGRVTHRWANSSTSPFDHRLRLAGTTEPSRKRASATLGLNRSANSGSNSWRRRFSG